MNLIIYCKELSKFSNSRISGANSTNKSNFNCAEAVAKEPRCE